MNSCDRLKNDIAKKRQFRFVRELFDAFPKAEVFVVGGAVRDALLGRESKDYDFVVRNVPQKKLELFLRERGVVNLVGKRFGVFKFVPSGSAANEYEPFDISLPRTEYSIGHSGHYRDFAIKTDYRLGIDVDLSRRDFTVNAIAWNTATRSLVDPFGGVSDIKEKRIRAVGAPARRFAEDYSRMLRALRFSCQLGFTIEEKTLSAIRREIKHLNKEVAIGSGKSREIIRVVPHEVIAREMVKSFVAAPLAAFDLYDNLNVFAVVMPEMMRMKRCPQDSTWHSEGDVWTHARLTLSIAASKKFEKEFGESPEPLMVLISFLHDIGKPYTITRSKKDGLSRIHFYGHDRVGAEIVRRIFERLRFSSVERFNVAADDAHWLVKHHLLLLNSDIAVMKNTTIEKYFFANPRRGKLLLQLIFCDSCATVRADKKTSLGSYRQFLRRLEIFRKTARAKKVLPKSVLNGKEIMKTLSLSPGPRIGELLEALREEQLAGRVKTKQQALTFLRMYENNHPKGAGRSTDR